MTDPIDRPLKDSGRLAEAHTARGVALVGRGQLREAIEPFREAVGLVPDNAIARSNLGMTLGRAGALDGDEGKLAEAVEQLRWALRLQPGNVGLHHKLAAVLAIADRAHDALAVLDEALRLDPSNANTRGLRSVALLTLGDFARGWLDFDLRQDDPARRARDIPGVPRWQGETLTGALLINGLAEGQGDCFQGIRFAAEARRRVGGIVMCCLPSMARLMGRCEGIDRVVTSREGLPAVAEGQILHYLRASQTLAPAGLTLGGNSLGSTRNDAYRTPGAYDELAKGLTVLDSASCAGVNPSPPSTGDTTLDALVQQYVFRSTSGSVAVPACRQSALIPGFDTQFPHLTADPAPGH